MRSRSRAMLARMSAVVLLAGIVGVGLVRPGVPSAEPTVSQFLLAWESRQYLKAAELTTGSPHAVAAELASAYERLDASDLNLSMRGVSQQGKAASASFHASIDLAGSGLTWSYANSFALRDGSSGWRVVWSPSVIVPGMTDREQLAVVSSWDQRSQLLDSAGQPLTVPSTVYQVGVVPDELTDLDATADGLADATGPVGRADCRPDGSGSVRGIPASAHPVASRVRRAEPQAGEDPRPAGQEADGAAVRQHRSRCRGLRRNRDRRGAAGQRSGVPAGHNCRPVRAGADLPAPADRHSAH